ncbi:ABC transporter permease [Candidatus Berkelbacteria bacterium]|nr:ABC transporter permease [Candidatus Berkelbacteria bacterium]
MKTLKGIYILWLRDLVRFWRNKTRVIAGLSFPVLWLMIFGNGISASLSLPIPGVKFVQFLFPGIIAQYLLFTATFSAISILQDREFGFLKEVLVSPINRSSIAIGKVLGGATVSTLQALPILVLAPLVKVGLTPVMVLLLIPAMLLTAIALSALGVAIAARLKTIDAGQYIFQFITFPLVFLSGAVFPLVNLPRWLDIAAKLNPISYAVDLLRKILFSHSSIPSVAIEALSPRLGGKIISVSLELTIVIAFSLVMIALAAAAFNRAD